MRTDDFDFELPAERIALTPARPRDAARLLVVAPGATDGAGDGAAGVLTDRQVRDLPELLQPGDALVVNDTRVIPAELAGRRLRGDTEARVAFNLHKRLDGSRWRAFARPAKRLQPGDRLRFSAADHSGDGDVDGSGAGAGRVCFAGVLEAVVEAKGSGASGNEGGSDGGEVTLAFSLHGAYLDEAIVALGRVPLPPYIAAKRSPSASDASDYQTIYAAREGAVAAPTAGLHFTPDLLARLAERGISRHTVTLHVGAGTFLPVKVADTRQHRMHAEWGEVSAETAAALNAVKARGGRIVAVGTTSLRLLESAAGADGGIAPFSGDTDIFITPGYRFRAVDVLLTNFHLPRSTLFMLVSAFSGFDTMRAAYAHAIAEGYRFYSFGDACLLQRLR